MSIAFFELFTDDFTNIHPKHEGTYILEVDKLFYFIAGPKGETHKEYANVDGTIVTHIAHLFPEVNIKSYKSEMHLKKGKLFYYVNYSKKTETPKEVNYSKTLTYKKIRD